jgi:hypothetical protein
VEREPAPTIAALLAVGSLAELSCGRPSARVIAGWSERLLALERAAARIPRNVSLRAPALLEALLSRRPLLRALRARLADASPRQAQALGLYLGHRGGRVTLAAVGRRMGISRERTRQHLARCRGLARRPPDLVAWMDDRIDRALAAVNRALTVTRLAGRDRWFRGVSRAPRRFARLLVVLGSRHRVLAREGERVVVGRVRNALSG